MPTAWFISQFSIFVKPATKATTSTHRQNFAQLLDSLTPLTVYKDLTQSTIIVKNATMALQGQKTTTFASMQQTAIRIANRWTKMESV